MADQRSNPPKKIKRGTGEPRKEINLFLKHDCMSTALAVKSSHLTNDISYTGHAE